MSYSDANGSFDGASDADGSLGQVYVVGNPGKWTEDTVTTPEPSSLISLLAGIAALAVAIYAIRWRVFPTLSAFGRCAPKKFSDVACRAGS
jgi:hypothetical protein